MMRRAMMYLRPGNLYKEFVIEDNKADIGKTGRATASFSGDGSRTLKGALAEATPKQKVEWQTASASDFPHDHTGWTAEGKGRRQADTGRKNILDSGHR